MDEKIYFSLGAFGIRVPASAAPLCTPKAYDLASHGIDWSLGYTCQSCGVLTELKDRPKSSSCEHCGRLWPVRCNGEGCDSLLEPDHSNGQWYEPYPYCQPCDRSRLAESRSSLMREIPSATLHNAIKGWRKIEHRTEAQKELVHWLSHDLGRNWGNRTGVYIYGPVGSGKTTLAARAACKAIQMGKVTSFEWVKEYDLMMATKASGHEARAEASRFLKQVEIADLVVVDEVFSVAENLTSVAKDTLSELFAKRFERRLPTIITSNHDPAWAHLYNVRVDSRFNGMFSVVKLDGPDLRQHFGGDPGDTRDGGALNDRNHD
jgi:DNA replication protein DnaC